MVKAYPSPGEINLKINDAKKAIDVVREQYQEQALSVDTTDGISMEFSDWRFNLRVSNTEPVVRLNLETSGDKELLEECQKALLSVLESI